MCVQTRFRCFAPTTNGLSASCDIGVRIMTRAKKKKKNGTSGHKYGTFIGFKRISDLDNMPSGIYILRNKKGVKKIVK